MRTLARVVFYILIPFGLAHAVTNQGVGHWLSERSERELVTRFFNQDLCYQSPELLRACGRGLIASGFALPEFSLTDAKRFDFVSALLGQLEEMEPTVRSQLLSRAINAELASLDAHARLEPAAKFSETAQVDHTSFGIGVDYEITGAGTLLRRVYLNTPAARAGLRVGDRLLKIDDQTVAFGLRAPKALARLNQAGTHALTIERAGKLVNLSVTPEALNVPGVIAEFTSYGLHLLVRNFGIGVCDSVSKELARIEKGATLVLDLRNNAGGDVGEAACLFGLLHGPGEFVTKVPLEQPLLPSALGLNFEFGATAQEAWRKRIGDGPFKNQAVVILINGASASAAEMVAASLQDAGRAWVVGQRTFGKGTTQGESAQTFDPKLNLFYTVSRFYRPHGEPLQGYGVTPNFEVPFDRRSLAAAQVTWRETDWFPNALEAEAKGIWRDPRAREALRVKTCAESKNIGQVGDDQLRFAFALEKCAT